MRGLSSRSTVVAEAQSLERAGAHRLDHDMGVSDEVLVRLDARVGLEVEHDRALAPADVQVEQRVALDDRPRHLSDVVAAGRFDLDDVGAEVGQMGGDGSRSEHR